MTHMGKWRQPVTPPSVNLLPRITSTNGDSNSG
eukprot:CAMPEP_0177766792 /NCGR_PEP_ID=MMETSP0491_2-20121128/8711_1 /TAXON_ID=63592 /ORGANISM="Tetraselmis chuii, Strain PLY429" /LENGTH=32 /DNA_ID= /DNA_START= /DNA_END= /DNA_ORIENTATION=